MQRRAGDQRDRRAARRPRRAGHERERVRARDSHGERRRSTRRSPHFPDVLEQGSVTFRNLRAALVDLNELTDVSKPQTKSLAPFLQRLRATCSGRCARRSRTCAGSSTSPGPRNDSVDLMRDAAGARADLARRASKNSVAALKAGPGRDRVPAALRARHLGLDHALRAGPRLLRRERPLRARAADLQRLLATTRAHEPAELARPGRARQRVNRAAATRFCPGAATQPAPDGSNPFTDDGKLAPTTATRATRPVGTVRQRLAHRRLCAACARDRRAGRRRRRRATTTAATTRSARSSTTPPSRSRART